MMPFQPEQHNVQPPQMIPNEPNAFQSGGYPEPQQPNMAEYGPREQQPYGPMAQQQPQPQQFGPQQEFGGAPQEMVPPQEYGPPQEQFGPQGPQEQFRPEPAYGPQQPQQNFNQRSFVYGTPNRMNYNRNDFNSNQMRRPMMNNEMATPYAPQANRMMSPNQAYGQSQAVPEMNAKLTTGSSYNNGYAGYPNQMDSPYGEMPRGNIGPADPRSSMSSAGYYTK